jgi:hypothetical protein
MNAQTALIAHHPGLAGLALAGPIGSFDAYLERVGRIPVLTREQEQELAQRFRATTIWMPRASWCSRTCDSSCTSPVAIRVTVCR